MIVHQLTLRGDEFRFLHQEHQVLKWLDAASAASML